MNLNFNPYLQLVIVTVFFGFTSSFVKIINLPAPLMTFFRTAVPALVLLAVFVYQKNNVFRGNIKPMLLASFLNAVRMFLFFLGFLYTSVGSGIIMVYTWPLFAAILGVFFLKEKIEKRNILLFFVAFVGIIFTYLDKQISFANAEFYGMILLLISAFLYSFTVIIFKKESKKYSNYEMVFYQNCVGAILFLPSIFFVKILPTVTQTSLVLIYAFLTGLLAFSLFFSALKRIKASTASFMTCLEVVFATIYGIILFKETLEWNIIVGGILIIGSVLLLKREKPDKK